MVHGLTRVQFPENALFYLWHTYRGGVYQTALLNFTLVGTWCQELKAQIIVYLCLWSGGLKMESLEGLG